VPRRFPPPWTVEETDACFIVRDHNGRTLAYVYFEDEPWRCGTAFHQAAEDPTNAKLPPLVRNVSLS